jgi:alcohol dehydrogenase (cytochrome c)
MLPSPEGTLVYPSVNGAANWWSPSYSPKTGLFYAMAFDGADIYVLAEAEYQEGELFVGGYGKRDQPIDQYVSAVRAIDPTTGERKWQYQVQSKSTAGVLATAGGVVFGGDVAGNFFALDDTTGQKLWHRSLGGRVHAGPISYLVDGRQHVTIAAGQALFTFALPAP